ncbi:MAG: hypothetical protein MHMPM18_004980 [Marteilia pararefringens]
MEVDEKGRENAAQLVTTQTNGNKKSGLSRKIDFSDSDDDEQNDIDFLNALLNEPSEAELREIRIKESKKRYRIRHINYDR